MPNNHHWQHSPQPPSHPPFLLCFPNSKSLLPTALHSMACWFSKFNVDFCRPQYHVNSTRADIFNSALDHVQLQGHFLPHVQLLGYFLPRRRPSVNVPGEREVPGMEKASVNYSLCYYCPPSLLGEAGEQAENQGRNSTVWWTPEGEWALMGHHRPHSLCIRESWKLFSIDQASLTLQRGTL